MIQRIQSLYFLLSAVSTMLTLFFPFFTYSNGKESVYALNLFSLFEVNTGELVRIPWGVLSLGLLSFVLAIVVIFMYENRKRQIKFSMYLFQVSLLGFVTCWVYGISYANTYSLDYHWHFTIGLLLLSSIFAVLGLLAVRKDEKLVRAADRIR